MDDLKYNELDYKCYRYWDDGRFVDMCRAHRRNVRHGAWALGVISGCFDLLHVGHVNLITQACVPRDGAVMFLVALLNSDASVRRLKGPHRPIIPLAARLCHVSRIRGVQAAAGFDDDTPEEALARLKPDFLFKGSEYEGTAIPGSDHCGAVIFVPQTIGFSTTIVEQKIVAAAGGHASVPKDGPTAT